MNVVYRALRSRLTKRTVSSGARAESRTYCFLFLQNTNVSENSAGNSRKFLEVQLSRISVEQIQAEQMQQFYIGLIVYSCQQVSYCGFDSRRLVTIILTGVMHNSLFCNRTAVDRYWRDRKP